MLTPERRFAGIRLPYPIVEANDSIRAAADLGLSRSLVARTAQEVYFGETDVPNAFASTLSMVSPRTGSGAPSGDEAPEPTPFHFAFKLTISSRKTEP